MVIIIIIKRSIVTLTARVIIAGFVNGKLAVFVNNMNLFFYQFTQVNPSTLFKLILRTSRSMFLSRDYNVSK